MGEAEFNFLHVPILSSWDFGYFRSPGPGLGNLLFPIARAVVAQSEVGGDLLFPTIRQLKFGPYLRFEDDKRTYGNIFRKRSHADWLQWGKLHCSSIIPHKTKVIRYEGLGNQFFDIYGRNKLLRTFFEDRLRTPVDYEDVDIAIHLRLGDFSPADRGGTGQNFRNSRLFYEKAFELACDVLGNKNAKVMLFTDASETVAFEYLKVKSLNVERKVNALHSMLKMSRAKVIITSRSTFSLWAQFFGDTYAIWPHEFTLGNYKPLDPVMDILV